MDATPLPAPALRDLARRLGVVMQTMVNDDLSAAQSPLRVRLVERISTLADVIATLRAAAAGMRTPEAATASLRPSSQAGTPAPPTIPLTAEPGTAACNAADPSAPADATTEPASDAPPPVQAAGGPIVRVQHRRPSGGGKPIAVWVPERDALLHAEFPTCTDSEALFERLNAIEAPAPVASIEAMGQRAIKLGIKRTTETLRHLMRAATLRGLERANASRMATLGASSPRGVTGIASEAQEAALRDLWPTDATVAAITQRLSEMDGPTISAKSTIYRMARLLNLPVPRPVAAGAEESPAFPEPDPQPAPVPAPVEHGSTAKAWAGSPRKGALLPAVPDDRAEVFEAFDGGMTVRDVAAEFGLPLSTLSNWQAEWRRERAAG